MLALGWAKITYYVLIGSTAGLLFISGTIVHVVAAVALTMASPIVYRWITSSNTEKIRIEAIETTLTLAQERYWQQHPTHHETGFHEDDVQG